jgi:hypothetical protein
MGAMSDDQDARLRELFKQAGEFATRALNQHPKRQRRALSDAMKKGARWFVTVAAGQHVEVTRARLATN